jgi:hypothetical protein
MVVGAWFHSPERRSFRFWVRILTAGAELRLPSINSNVVECQPIGGSVSLGLKSEKPSDREESEQQQF